MKKVITLIVLILPLSIFAQKTAKVSGSLKNVKDTINKVLIYYSINGKRITDSAGIANNQYSFSASIAEPVRVQLVVKDSTRKQQRITQKSVASVYLEPGNITITSVDSFSNVTVKGSKANDEFVKLNGLLKPYNERKTKLYAEYAEYRKAKNKEQQDIVEAKIDSLDEEINNNVYGGYVKANPKSPIALYALQNAAGYGAFDVVKIESLYDKLSDAVKNSEAGIAFKKKIETAKNLEIGKTAFGFTQNDTLGNPVSLSSFKGKYVLLDFWASWCGPCRAENPNVVKAFNQFKDKNFTVLSVSLDRPDAKDKWLKAIHDDNLTWTHVSDLQFWDNAVSKLYGIQSIPASFLLDPQGKIIGKNLRGEELVKKLKEVL